MSEKIRVITEKLGIPTDTVSKKGFHLLNMGKEGMWLVDQDHIGYPGCVKKAIHIATQERDYKRVEQYRKLPGWQKVWINPNIAINQGVADEEPAE